MSLKLIKCFIYVFFIVTYPLLVDQKYVVGRKQGDITFPEDQSVSRIHAELIVEHPSGNIVSLITSFSSVFSSCIDLVKIMPLLILFNSLHLE